MDSRGRGGDGGVRGGRGGRSVRDRGRRDRGVGGNRGNEPGEASSSQAATQEESLPSDSLHQSNQPARPSFPPPTRTRHPPTSFPYNYNDRDFIGEGNLPPSPSEPLNSVQRDFPAAREVQPQRQGALQRRERNLAGGSQQSSSGQSDSSRTARQEPVHNLELEIGPPNASRKRRNTGNQPQPSTWMDPFQGVSASSLPLPDTRAVGPPQMNLNTSSHQSPAQYLADNPQNFTSAGILGRNPGVPNTQIFSYNDNQPQPSTWMNPFQRVSASSLPLPDTRAVGPPQMNLNTSSHQSPAQYLTANPQDFTFAAVRSLYPTQLVSREVPALYSTGILGRIPGVPNTQIFSYNGSQPQPSTWMNPFQSVSASSLPLPDTRAVGPPQMNLNTSSHQSPAQYLTANPQNCTSAAGQSDSSRTARQEPVPNLELDLELRPPNTSRKRRNTEDPEPAESTDSCNPPTTSWENRRQ